MKNEQGQALPLAIMALAIGALVTVPFVSYAGLNLASLRIYDGIASEAFACDAGIEHAIWSLIHSDLAGQFSQPGDMLTYQLDETLNGLTVTVTVTANATGAGFAGDIADEVIASLQFDSTAYEPAITHISGDVYAIAYRSTNSRGFIKTVTISPSGEITSTPLASLQFDSTAYEPAITHVSGDIYAIAYRGAGNEGFITTFNLAANGAPGAVIATLEYDPASSYKPSLTHVSGNIYAIAYRGQGNSGRLKTVTVRPDGSITGIIDSLIFDDYAYEPCLIKASDEIYAIAYRGPANRGYLNTVKIENSGEIAQVTDTMRFASASSYAPVLIRHYGDIYAIAYRGQANGGFVRTVRIASSGAVAAFEIFARAGERAVRALVNADNTTASIVFWQVE